MEPKPKIRFDVTFTNDTESDTWTVWDSEYEPIDYTDLIEAMKKVKEWEKSDRNNKKKIKKEESWNPSKRYYNKRGR